MENTTKICNYVKEQRELSGMSIAEVAEASGVSESTIKNLSANKIPTPGFWTVANIVKAIGGSLDEVAGIPRANVDEHEKKVKELSEQLEHSERDYTHLQATIKSKKCLLEDREKTINWLRKAIIVISATALVILIVVFSVLIYDVQHPNIGYFTDDVGNIHPYVTGEDGWQNESTDNGIISTSFDYSMQK